MPSGADNLTLPTTFYRGAVSDSPTCASEAPVRRSRRERLLRLYSAALFAGDAAIWLLVIVSLSLSLPGLQPANHLPTISLISLPLLCIASVLYSINGYARNADMQSLEFTSTYLIGIVVAFCLSVAAVYFLGTFGDETQPRRILLPLSFALFAPSSLLIRRVLGARMARSTERKGALLVIGSGEDAVQFHRSFRRMGDPHALRFIDPCVETNSPFLLDGPGSPAVDPRWGRRIALAGSRYDAVILARNPSELPAPLTQKLVDIHFHKIPVLTVEAFFETHWRRVYLHGVSPKWIFQEGFRLTSRSGSWQVKRLIDIGVSGAALILLFPLLVLIAAAILLESRGQVIFRQERVGLRGRVFSIRKFRTMRNAPEGDIYTRDDDNRVTRLGAFLRKTRLDELPQLWNVLRGEMSLIGPRAEWTRCAEIYEKEIPNYHLRHLVRPGITGWAQVNCPYGENIQDAIEKLRFDLYYIRHFSLLLDWSLMLKTIYVMLFGKGR